MSLVSKLDKKFYPLVGDRWDDAIFRDRLLQHLKPDMIVLDLGAGAGIIPEMNFRGKVKKMYGLDPDERVMSNQFLDAAACSTAEEMSFEDEMFDVIICQNVMEHIENPLVMLTQVKRVLNRTVTIILPLLQEPPRMGFISGIINCVEETKKTLSKRFTISTQNHSSKK